MSIYNPREDSYLLQEVLNNIDTKKINPRNPEKINVLEIGSGSGILAETILSKGILRKNITLTDINPEAVKKLKNKFSKSKIIKSDLFSNIPENEKNKYNLIIFNPPYLPEAKGDLKGKESKDSQLATTGGEKGSEIINKFLKQAKKYLKENGKIYLLTSSLTKGLRIPKEFKKELIKTKNLFMEKLYVWEIRFI